MFSYGKNYNGLHGRMQKLDMIKETEKPDLSTPKTAPWLDPRWTGSIEAILVG